ncbi:MAG: hypothetical protein ABIS47_14325 [Acidimicrobiales bacterium]
MPRLAVRSGSLAVGVLSLAVACGSSSAEGSPTVVVAAAPAATVAAGPAQVTIERFGLRAEGVVDLARGAVRLTVVDATAPGAAPIEVLAVGDRGWTRPAGTATWTPSDPEAAGLLSLPGGLRSGDPRAAVDLVRGAARVTVFGGLQVQATSTIRYDVFSDPVAAARSAGPAAAPRLLALGAAVSHTVRVDVYVDAGRRIRRLEVPEDLRSATPVTRPDTNRISATIDFVRFGVDPGDLSPPG